ncbi:MAG: hypothetical protein MJ241_02265 [Bacilli bacterium]|nr:hypothetical protein [Bacilli bacterium]
MLKHRFGLPAILSATLAGACVLSLALSIAWFDTVDDFSNSNWQASTVSNYFAGGDGTENNPYRLTQPVHVYNLAWLQQRGAFDEYKTYFKAADANGNPVTIDFAGKLDGNSGRTGAVPPIGTETHPFKGVFDGNGSVFQNVWVSSDPNDWKEKPAVTGDADTNRYVGFFGAIEQEGDRKGEVRNFYLENIEVTSHVTASKVGLIAGYSNSTTQNIGVKNGKMSFKAVDPLGTYSYESEASLVGKIGDKVKWEDIPSDTEEGGSLKINPNELNITTTSGTYLTSSQTVVVPKSAKDSAFISGALNVRSQSLGIVYKYNGSLSFSHIPTSPVSITKTNNINASQNQLDYSIVKKEFWDNYKYLSDNGLQSKVLVQQKNVRPDPSNPNTVNLSTGETMTIPKNCIWFKPKNPGTCSISFTCDNMSGTRYTSIYRYKRNGTSIPSKNQRDEITLSFYKNGGFPGNSDVMYYDIEIDQTEIDEGYEYCIGAPSTTSTTNTEPGFVFLYLPGASESGGPSTATAFLKNLDYVYKLNGVFLPDFTDPNYHPNHVMLMTSFSTQSDEFMLFNMDDIQNSTHVYYYTSRPGIVDSISASATVGVKQTTTDKFPPRIETS